MFDFFEEYKIYIISTIIFLIIVGISYYFYNYKKLEVNNLWKNNVAIKLDKSKKEIKLTNDLKNIDKKDNYNYQVKIYLSEYELSCKSKKEICDKIIKNKDKLNNFILWNYSWELKKLDEFKLNLDDFFSKKFDKNVFKNNVIDLLYTFQNNFIKETNIKNTWFEKYFKFKLKNWEKNIVLNNLEIQCASEIKMSVTPWTFEEDKIISKKVEENCKNLWWEKFLTLEKNKKSNTKENKEINLEIEIKKLKVNYIFFKKENWKFKKIDSKEIILDYEKKYIFDKYGIKEGKSLKKQNNNNNNKVVDFKDKIVDLDESLKKQSNDNKDRLNKLLRKKYKEKLNKILIERFKGKN